MFKVGIVGCGAIGSYLLQAIVRNYQPAVKIAGVCELDDLKVKELSAKLKCKLKRYSLAELVEKSDLIIEACTAEFAVCVVEQALKFKREIMVMSVGALVNHPELIEQAVKQRINLYIPSGAVAGLDALKAARMGKIKKVVLITKKPVQGLTGAEYIRKKNIDLSKIKTEAVIFEGSAAKAVLGFPKNINVAAILSLAGIGAKKTKVKIIASRLISKNIHTIEILGDFGKIVCCTENVPSELNKKTSKLAMFSALAAFERILNKVKIGT
ncbi:MAG: aspartate dehydrogenase [Candidatus Omnitrophota bacterium]|nr:MAG: aspartate dehydrogenase [Candidatus Omnitrophota bacterium]